MISSINAFPNIGILLTISLKPGRNLSPNWVLQITFALLVPFIHRPVVRIFVSDGTQTIRRRLSSKTKPLLIQSKNQRSLKTLILQSHPHPTNLQSLKQQIIFQSHPHPTNLQSLKQLIILQSHLNPTNLQSLKQQIILQSHYHPTNLHLVMELDRSHLKLRRVPASQQGY